MVCGVQVGNQGEGSLIGNRKVHHGLAERASEGVHLGVGAAAQDGVVAFLSAGECQLFSWAGTGGKLGLLAAMWHT